MPGESEPNREDLAFLLERECRLGAAYAGVLVDHTQVDVEHSLRWDVLPVRIRGAKQHAKISLLAWTNHLRIIVASANLTEAGYRFNHEVAIAIDVTPQEAPLAIVADAVRFLRCLLAFVPGAEPTVPEIQRALSFLNQVERQVANWKPMRPSKNLRQHLIFTLPARDSNSATGGPGFEARGSLSDAVAKCRQRGGSPADAWIASPFFDVDHKTNVATAALCKAMARGSTRQLTFCVPAVGEPDEKALRLAAPVSLLNTPGRYSAEVSFEILPQRDSDKNARPWHAKMLALQSPEYSALLSGSSNFTQAGLGIGNRHNAEANVLTIAQRRPHAREPGQLESLWNVMIDPKYPESAEWLGTKSELDEEANAQRVPLPDGFLNAIYRAGDKRQLVFRFDLPKLPASWTVNSCGPDAAHLIDSERWKEDGGHASVELSWTPVHPPETIMVRWPEGEAFWPLNVDDPRQLPPPAELENMSADDMLLILAASDPSAALRALAKRQRADQMFDDELDSATPTDLDPLRRYDLRTTFLRRIRSRARVLAMLRQNLERPVWSKQALQWRLDGFIGVRPLAQRLARDVTQSDGQVDEALLTLADFLIVLREVNYRPADGSLPKSKVNKVFRPFLKSLILELDEQVRARRSGVGKELIACWDRMVKRCRV
ncbi:MAG: hypothetical protein O3A00_16755 [Planctomycetota bacterium]|nr:hypothetical protein [Planctomycetota bacterium]